MIVVGAGQSGAQIAEDLHLAGRQVHLVTGAAPRCARFYRGRDVVDWLWDIGQYEITVADDGMGHKRHDTNHYLTGRDGGRDIDLRAFATQGMALYGRLDDVRAGRMSFAPNLTANLDDADRVYNGINALIDRHIADKRIAAPPPRSISRCGRRPTNRRRSISPASARSFGRPASRRTGRMCGCRSSTAPATRCIGAASPASPAPLWSACRGCGPGVPAASSPSGATPSTSSPIGFRRRAWSLRLSRIGIGRRLTFREPSRGHDERLFGGKNGSNGEIDREHFGQKIAPLNAGRVAVGDDRALVHERKHIRIA